MSIRIHIADNSLFNNHEPSLSLFSQLSPLMPASQCSKACTWTQCTSRCSKLQRMNRWEQSSYLLIVNQHINSTTTRLSLIHKAYHKSQHKFPGKKCW